jgi:hypothetical protein
LQTRCFLLWSSPSFSPLCTLFLIDILKFLLYLQIIIQEFEDSVVWNPFILIFIPTII